MRVLGDPESHCSESGPIEEDWVQVTSRKGSKIKLHFHGSRNYLEC